MIRDKEQRLAAVVRLGVALRDRLDTEAQLIYLEDTQRVETAVLVEACRRLEKSAQFFPKVSELLSACNLVAKEHELRAAQLRPKLAAPAEPTPERKAELLAKIRAACQGRASGFGRFQERVE